MKKIIILTLTFLCLIGCSNNKNSIKNEEKKETSVDKEEYIVNDIKFSNIKYDKDTKKFDFQIMNTSSDKMVSYVEVIFLNGKEEVYAYHHDLNQILINNTPIEIGVEFIDDIPNATDYDFKVSLGK